MRKARALGLLMGLAAGWAGISLLPSAPAAAQMADGTTARAAPATAAGQAASSSSLPGSPAGGPTPVSPWRFTIEAEGLTLQAGPEKIWTGIQADVHPANAPVQHLAPGEPTEAGVPFGEGLVVSPTPSPIDPRALILRARYSGGPVSGNGGIALRIAGWPGFEKALAIHGLCWTFPVWLDKPGQVPGETEFLLVRRASQTDRYLVVVPLVSGGMRVEMRPAGESATLTAVSGDDRYAPRQFDLAVLCTGDDPYALIDRAYAAAMHAMGTGRLRKDKAVPDFVNYFGWCSWNAYGQGVSEQNLTDAMRSFAEGGLHVGFYILDDGWQDTDGYNGTGEDGRQHNGVTLKSFRPNRKFPNGLGPVIARIKSQTGLKYFGVWHTLHGYWQGSHPQGELVGAYGHFQDVNGLYYVKPEESFRFYQDYHDQLREQGVDFLKVDCQSGIEPSVRQRYPVGQAARLYHQALEGSVAVHFQGQMINCMCMSTANLYNLPVSNVARNSDDYFPRRPDDPGLHTAQNAYNNLWAGQLAISDWDMFESNHPYGELHAMARAVSGSPIYCTDRPGRQNFDLLRKLVLSDGRALRCPNPALVTRDCLFVDPQKEAVLLKLFNRLPTGHGLLGVFNLRSGPAMPEQRGQYGVFTPEQRQALSATAAWGPGDVEGLAGESFAVYSHRTGELHLMRRDEQARLTLRKFESDVLVLAPVTGGCAVLGLMDKYNSPAAIERWGFERPRFVAHLLDGGTVGFYCRQKPRQVTVNGQPVEVEKYDPASGALTVQVPPGRPATVELLPAE